MRKIHVVKYDPNWVEVYKETEKVLKNILQSEIVNIEHIGSTAIKGLSAKPTLDVLVIVNDIEKVSNSEKIMLAHGFIGQGEGGIPGRRYFYKSLPDDPFTETHHIHIYQDGNPKYQEELKVIKY